MGLGDEGKLLDVLLHDYNPAARPVTNVSEAVEVRMGLALFSVIDLVRHMQPIVCTIYIQFKIPNGKSHTITILKLYQSRPINNLHIVHELSLIKI